MVESKPFLPLFGVTLPPSSTPSCAGENFAEAKKKLAEKQQKSWSEDEEKEEEIGGEGAECFRLG